MIKLYKPTVSKEIEAAIDNGDIREEESFFLVGSAGMYPKPEPIKVPYTKLSACTIHGAELLAESPDMLVDLFNYAYDLTVRNELRRPYVAPYHPPGRGKTTGPRSK